MRCDNCMAANCTGGEYPEEYCAAFVPEKMMVEFDNGEMGCKFPLMAIKARVKKAEEAEEEQYRFIGEWVKECDYRERNGIDVRDVKGPFISDAMHCIGLDYKKPYTRHGRKFYRPYRNYFNTRSDSYVWSILVDIGYAEEYAKEFFRLTPAGINWLENCLSLKILSERD